MKNPWYTRVGWFVVVALTIASFSALFVVSQRVHVTIASEESSARRGPDPIALVAADVAAVRDELRALGERFTEELAARDAAVEAAADRRADAHRADLEALSRSLSGLERRVAALTAVDARLVPQTPLAAAPAEPDPAPALASSTAVVDDASPTALRDTSPGAASAPADAKAKKGFLAFKSTGSGFAFDALQRFVIVPSLSRVGFDARSTLHDFSGACSNVGGEFQVDLSRPEVGCAGSVRASAAALDTGLADRDAEMRKVLGVAEFAEIRFDWKTFETAEVDTAAMKVNGTAHGTLSLHGVTRDVAVPVRVAVDASRRVSVDGEFHVRLTDFGIEPPHKLGVIAVADDVVVWIALRARLAGAVTEKHP